MAVQPHKSKMMAIVVAAAAVAVFIGMVMDPATAQDDGVTSCISNQDCQDLPLTRCFIENDGGGNNQSGTCQPNVIGDLCEYDYDCLIENSHCRRTKCRCKLGFLKSGDSECKALEIGMKCWGNRQCQAMIGNSECFLGSDGNKTCSCMNGYYFPESNNNINSNSKGNSNNEPRDQRIHCEPVLGKGCNLPGDCGLIRGNVTCLNGECRCKQGYTMTNKTTSFPCEPISLNGMCTVNEDCINVKDSMCQIDIAKCVCKERYREDKSTSTCVKKLEHTNCDDDTHCLPPNAACDHMTGSCVCKDGYKFTQDGSGCYFNFLGDSCKISEDCDTFVNNSECSNDICSCRNDYVPARNKSSCEEIIVGHVSCTTINDSCHQLFNHSYCRDSDSVCACQTGYDATSDLKHCHAKNLGDSCSSHEDCNTTNDYSECSGNSKTCQCISGYILEGNGTKSFCRRLEIGRDVCQTYNDCINAVGNSTCVMCKDMSNQLPFCADACEGIDREYCTAKTCVCEIGYFSHAKGTHCKRRKLQDECSVNEDCSASVYNSECLKSGIRGVCSCQSGYLPLGTETCKKRRLDDVCNSDPDCKDAITNSFCDNTIRIQPHCSCLSGYNKAANGTKCQKRQIGDKTCLVHSDCEDAVAGSLCFKGMCICRHGYFPGGDLYSCTARTLHGPYCSYNRDCNAVIDHSRCDNHTCVCETGYRVETDKKCVRFQLEDAGCRDDQDCTTFVDNTTCSSRVCTCATGYHPDIVTKETCVPRNISGHFCHKDEDCSHSVANSHCKDEQCECLSGFYHEQDGTLCSKRILGDDCNITSDCNDVIENSVCSQGICTCDQAFEPRNNDSCFLKPDKIGSPCFYDGHCKKIDEANVSICNKTNKEVTGICRCPDDTFVDVLQQECIKLPIMIGDRCRYKSQCTNKIADSKCQHGNRACACESEFFEDDGGHTCTPLPEQFGDRCLQDSHCSQFELYSTCDKLNNTCICKYGYTQVSSNECQERPHLPKFKQPANAKLVECNGSHSCVNLSNSDCDQTEQNITPYCQCRVRFAYYQGQCIPVQTYLYNLSITMKAGMYDYEPLPFNTRLTSKQLLPTQKLDRRITYSGIKQLLRKTQYRSRYVSSKVIDFQPLNNQSDSGVHAGILIYFKATPRYFGATSSIKIDEVIRRELLSSNGLLGDSLLIVGSPLRHSSVVSDFDECKTPGYNDCPPEATCYNTMGSFMCVCRSDHIDVSHAHGKRRGQVCEVPKKTASDSSLCSTADCETSWEFVGLVLTLVFLVVIAFIVYEIIQRKQNFNARKLYERFGTTRIRRLKLTTAGLKRLQERKKYRKKYKKKMQKEMKKNKKKKKRFGGKGHGSGTEDSDVEKSSPPTPNVMGTEEIPPSPSEIVHAPTIPVVDDGDDDDSAHDDDDGVVVVVVGDGDGAGGGRGGGNPPVTLHPSSRPNVANMTIIVDD